MEFKRWGSKDVQKLKTLLEEKKYTYAEIAKELGGGLTKNAIAGAVRRYNLWDKGPKYRPDKKEQKAKKDLKKTGQFSFRQVLKEKKNPATLVPSINDLEIPLTQRKTMLDIDMRKHCRWPVNNPGTLEFFYCGGQKLESSVYCEAHTRRAYRPARVR